LHPNIACITSMDADHLDIYGDSASIEASFVEFADKIEDKNNLFITTQLPLLGQTVGVGENANYQAVNIRIEQSAYIFDIKTKSELITGVRFALPGTHNLMNALMAFAMAKIYGVSDENSKKALASFKGIRRRFSYQIQEEKLVYIDDYAHHPTEINAVHQAVSELYPGRKVLAIFQPHLFSRTRDFADDFAKSLSAFDSVLLLDIYPARELPIEGITSSWLLDKMTNLDKKVVGKTHLIQEILKSDAVVFVTIGAGDIGVLVPSIKRALHEKV
jgi:UDP-N-acetylmuramate--alanine ligase